MKTDKQVADNLREVCKTANTLMVEIRARGYTSYFTTDTPGHKVSIRAPYKLTEERL